MNTPLYSTGNKPIYSLDNKPVFGDQISWRLKIQVYSNYALSPGGMVVWSEDDLTGRMDAPSTMVFAILGYGASSEGTIGYQRSRSGICNLTLAGDNDHGALGWDATERNWKLYVHSWRFGVWTGDDTPHTFNVDPGILVVAKIINADDTIAYHTDSLETVNQDILLDEYGENSSLYTGPQVATVKWSPVTNTLSVY
ncbi:hypothetical protein M0R72_21420 [Candidatus Pacearchaeota archaeon]|jgi:hypothetical protein|nr:hypothetical protein [Candidatus Pacearchaeota archaeon]